MSLPKPRSWNLGQPAPGWKHRGSGVFHDWVAGKVHWKSWVLICRKQQTSWEIPLTHYRFQYSSLQKKQHQILFLSRIWSICSSMLPCYPPSMFATCPTSVYKGSRLPNSSKSTAEVFDKVPSAYDIVWKTRSDPDQQKWNTTKNCKSANLTSSDIKKK